jgi:hypothetical protein
VIFVHPGLRQKAGGSLPKVRPHDLHVVLCHKKSTMMDLTILAGELSFRRVIGERTMRKIARQIFSETDVGSTFKKVKTDGRVAQSAGRLLCYRPAAHLIIWSAFSGRGFRTGGIFLRLLPPCFPEILAIRGSLRWCV